MAKTDQELQGLGGWLILLALVLLGMPGNFSAHVTNARRAFETPEARALMAPGSPTYDPRWQVLRTVETSATAVAIVPAIVLIVLFFVRHRSFAIAFSLLAIYIISLGFLRVFLVFSTPSSSEAYRNSVLQPSILSTAFLIAWIAYVFRSRRVRLTFTRRFYPQPYFPYFTVA
jgi:hypothetical protein